MSRNGLLTSAAALAMSLPLTALAAVPPEAPRVMLAMMDMEMGGGGAMQQQGQGGMPMGMGRGAMQQQAPGGMPMGGNAQLGQQGSAMQGRGQALPPTQAQPSAGGNGTQRGTRPNDTPNRMGGMAQGQAQMPMGQMPMNQMQMAPMQQPGMMAGCMEMMQNMMRMGGGQTGMAPMPGGGTAMPGMAMPGAMGTQAIGETQPAGSSAARLEGRIAFLRTELRITPAQMSAWDAFADSLRAGREHIDAARAALQEGNSAADPMARVEAYERHLRERAEAMHMTRMAFTTLYAQMDDSQKRVAATTMLPFIGAY